MEFLICDFAGPVCRSKHATRLVADLSGARVTAYRAGAARFRASTPWTDRAMVADRGHPTMVRRSGRRRDLVPLLIPPASY